MDAAEKCHQKNKKLIFHTITLNGAIYFYPFNEDEGWRKALWWPQVPLAWLMLSLGTFTLSF